MKNRRLFFVILTLCLACAALDARAQARILPLGDSDTSSFAPYSSYRYWLWHQLIDAGYNVDFVGTQYGVAGGPPGNSDFDQDNEGHPGWTSQDGAENIDSIAAATVPDIVLLDLGANDVLEGIPPERTQEYLTTIIDGLRAVNPYVIILMAKPAPYQDQDKRGMSMLKKVIKTVAKQENQPNSPVKMVNLAGGFNVRKDTYDGTHPNEKGEQKLAKKWFSALKKPLR